MRQKGLVQVYTGEGKGKTTAAAGLAMRAVSQGLKVCYVSFHKDPKRWGYGEMNGMKKLNIDVFNFAPQHPFCAGTKKRIDDDRLRAQCAQGLEFAREKFRSGKYGLVILDEILICVRDGFLPQEDVLSLIREKPKGLELVLTGRGAAKKLIAAADLVSWIRDIKHPYRKGVRRRKGIEY